MATAAQIQAALRNLRKARAALKPSAAKFMRKKGKTAGKAIATSVRKRTATFVEVIPGPRGGRKRYRFPIPDKTHARNALARIEQKKTKVTPAQKAKVVRRACRMLHGSGKEYRECCARHGVRP